MSGLQSSNWRSGASPRPDSPNGGAGDADALNEGRRIYLGNLSYSVKPAEVEQMLCDNGLGQFEKIHISVDAFTGRNPGYCFAEFGSREDAERALASLAGVAIHDRPLKVGPCHPKGSSQSERRAPGGAGATAGAGAGGREYQPTFERWGDWKGERRGAGRAEQGPYGALSRVAEMSLAEQMPRVFVGGLGKMLDQPQNDEEVREYFAGFNVKAISKRITPHPTAQERPGNHHYCFVDLESVEEAEAAIAKLNGKSVPSGTLRVQLAKRPAALAPGRTGTWRGRAKPEEGRGQNGEAAAAPTETTAEA
ncbi:hypothetical protein QBC33DRAFT_580490 [Phialemonium atrogriseum]|uniref:RRM domain-containing protein n=1 Tax=Phialemonium atrogriseum TaxID=1093897 RepID=A0AAJ0FD61_9PEZI|nr:uncharacterized protein QBC33DRAFT_580490 [Phialemonium atrogriseum]KAK1764276.1 hypothetical protein QBC33DRAFT_580490 [Phialemonium atrogriseum]